jgi:hypothetical protein
MNFITKLVKMLSGLLASQRDYYYIVMVDGI